MLLHMRRSDTRCTRTDFDVILTSMRRGSLYDMAPVAVVISLVNSFSLMCDSPARAISTPMPMLYYKFIRKAMRISYPTAFNGYLAIYRVQFGEYNDYHTNHGALCQGYFKVRDYWTRNSSCIWQYASTVHPNPSYIPI